MFLGCVMVRPSQLPRIQNEGTECCKCQVTLAYAQLADVRAWLIHMGRWAGMDSLNEGSSTGCDEITSWARWNLRGPGAGEPTQTHISCSGCSRIIRAEKERSCERGTSSDHITRRFCVLNRWMSECKTLSCKETVCAILDIVRRRLSSQYLAINL